MHRQFSSIPSEDPNLVRDFFTHANKEPGVVISACSMSPSGCHDFGTTLKAEFKDLDYMAVNVEQGYFGTNVIVAKEPNAPQKKWENIYITGCGKSDAAYIVSTLQGKYDFTQLKHVYIVAPPHQSKMCNDAYPVELLKDRFSFTGDYAARCSVDLLTSGVDCKPIHSVGLPLPYPILESQYKLAEKCFGLMYVRHTECYNPELSGLYGLGYLAVYFTSVASAAKNHHIDSPSVIVIGIKNETEKEIVDLFAKECGIEVQHTDRLPQADFIKAIKDIGLKDGYIACDGAQTLMQALCLGAKPLFFDDEPQNTAFCKQLLNEIPKELQPIAGAILGQTIRYDLLKDESQTKIVFKALQSLLQKSVEIFEKNKKLTESKSDQPPKITDPQSMDAAPFPSVFKSFGESVKTQLKRITGIDWKYSEPTKRAHFMLADTEKVEAIKHYLSSKGIDLIKEQVINTKEPTYVIKCSSLSISKLQDIPPLNDAPSQSKVSQIVFAN